MDKRKIIGSLGKWKRNGAVMIRVKIIFFLTTFSFVSQFLFLGCDPSVGGNPDKIYDNLVTLSKTPIQVINWTDSLWIHYSDNTWESFDIKLSQKKSLPLFAESNYAFTLSVTVDQKIWLLSNTGYVISLDLVEKTYSDHSVVNVAAPWSNTSELSLIDSKPTLLTDGKVYQLTGNMWQKLTFSNLNFRSGDLLRTYQKMGDTQFFGIQSYATGVEKNFYIRHKKSGATDTLQLTNGRLAFYQHKQPELDLIVLHGSGLTSINGLLSDESYVPYLNPISVKKPKVYNETEYFIGSSKNLSKLLITANGDFFERRVVSYQDLPSLPQDYWILGNDIILYLQNKQLVKVKVN